MFVTLLQVVYGWFISYFTGWCYLLGRSLLSQCSRVSVYNTIR